MNTPDKKLTWNDSNEIAEILMEKFPETPPVIYTEAELYSKIKEAGLDLPELKNTEDIYLTAIHQKMIKMWHGVDKIQYDDLLDELTYEDDSYI